MPRLDRRPALLGHFEQGTQLALALLQVRLATGRARRPRRLEVLRGLDLQRLLGQRLHDLEGEETEDVDDVVVGLAVGHDAEAGPLAEALALAEREGGLATVGPEDILVACHVLGAFVSRGEARKRRFVLLFFLFVVFFVVALGYLF